MELLDNHFIGIIENTTGTIEYDSLINQKTEKKPQIHSGKLDPERKINAYGKLFISNLDISFVYNGSIIDNLMNGTGNIVYLSNKENPTYKSYTGTFRENLFEGEGTLVFTNGDIFIGHFSHGKKNGVGKMYNSNGDLIMNNIWIDDIVSGKVEYIEYYHGTINPKIIGQLNNSIKVGHWLYIREDETIERIDYYDQSETDSNNGDELEEVNDSESRKRRGSKTNKSIKQLKSVGTKQSKTQIKSSIKTHSSGYIYDQRLNFTKKPTDEELCIGNFKYYDNKLSHNRKTECNFLDRGTESVVQDYEKLSEISIKTDKSLEEDGTLYLYLSPKGNKTEISEILNGTEYPKIIYLDESDKKYQKFVVYTNCKDSNGNILIKSSIYQIDNSIKPPVPVIHYSGELNLSYQPNGSGSLYSNGNVTLSGTFDKGIILSG